MRNARTTIGLVALATALACGREPARTPPPNPGTPLTLIVDGVESHPVVDATTPVVLATLLPAAARDPAAWRHLGARTAGPQVRELALDDPATLYAAHEVRLYRRGEALALGVFRIPSADEPPHVRAAAARPTTGLIDVAQIEVRTTEAVAPPPAMALEVRLGDRVVALDEAALLAIPDNRQAGSGGGDGNGGARRSRGWRLAELLAHVGAPAGAAVDVVDAGGQRERVVAADLAAAGGGPVLRRNQRGELQVIRPGAEDRVRAVVRLEVVLP
ncbi:MAG: hypothetical protein R2939_00475 [Kofleriaceae bacterium]